jgi:DNA-binding MarR family transcriptional regulator
MAPLIAALVERGLIDRQAVDGRSQALRLSASGRLLQSQARKVTETHEQLWFGELAPDARGDLIALLRGLWQERV